MSGDPLLVILLDHDAESPDVAARKIREALERESRYTLDEAERELARRECARFGHDWNVIETGARPTAITCGRCGDSHPVNSVLDEFDPEGPPAAVCDTCGRKSWVRGKGGVSCLVPQPDGRVCRGHFEVVA